MLNLPTPCDILVTVKPGRRGAKPLAELLPAIVEETLAARGLGEASLVLDWREIVGDTIARFARPVQLQWPPRAPRRDPEAPTAGSTLVLWVDGAFALEAQHSAAIIKERVNAHLGWRCVERVAFRQGPLPSLKPERRAPQEPTDKSKARARAAAERIEDPDLRDALTRLGARAIETSGDRVDEGPREEGD